MIDPYAERGSQPVSVSFVTLMPGYIRAPVIVRPSGFPERLSCIPEQRFGVANMAVFFANVYVIIYGKFAFLFDLSQLSRYLCTRKQRIFNIYMLPITKTAKTFKISTK